ncbi:TPA: hypothetical protein ACJETU_001060 [Acinetobacter baumannii]|uniref:DUF1311 domain-containing protein n=1 Tax=Acinetobacter baumannii TaxID=470 RepID=A0AAJ0QX38_ACIBA|nr:hypothetical protein [Acinetobacter baumannii]EHU2818852.1 hypothetical protein [Acinetobacter baumannii]EHU2823088.1 hypothetical protein [Acinetobacter baumannii]EHU2831626.1 hypothetical protein [Acinetobacter baumannii]EHU2947347.1 hypothetical protein [Acinetobacter baumannii]EHU2950708.1 hypothetical protein [Acinetobacter baumannii]
MRLLISFFLLISFGQFVHADSDEYSVAVGYSADFCDISSNETCITHFDELTNSLFKKWGDSLPYNYFEDDHYNANIGLQNLYCAALSDHIRELKYAPIFFDNGMKFIDDYAAKHAVRESKSYDDLRNMNSTNINIPKYHQSWLINDKNILKGVIFSGISNILNDADVATDGDLKRLKIKKKMKESYDSNCMPLL